MRRYWPLVPLIPWPLLVACGEIPSASIGTIEQPILGGTGTSGCSRGQRTVLRHALLLGRARVLSADFATCMTREITSRPFVPCVTRKGQTDRFPIDPQFPASAATAAMAVQVAQAENGARIDCEDLQAYNEVTPTTRGLTLWHDIHHPSYDGIEQLSLDSDGFLDRALDLEWPKLASVANTIWHEQFHTHGFWHGAPGTNCIGQELYNSMPVIGGECIGAGPPPCADQSGCPEGGTVAFVAGSDCTCLDVLGGPEPPCNATNSFPNCDDDFTFLGPANPIHDLNEEGDSFGAALAAGDFDGDGFDDLAVGAPGEDGGRGAVDVYFGTRLGLMPLLRLRGVSGSAFGTALVTTDFDGDGLADLAIGSPGFAAGRGSVSVMRGIDRDFGQVAGLDFLPERRQYLFGQETGDRFGTSLASTGTVSNLGVAVLAVGAPGRRRGTGAVQIFVESRRERALVLARELTPAGMEAGSQFGLALGAGRAGSAAQSFDALIVGAPLAAGGRGRAYVLDSAGLLLEPWLGASSGAASEIGAALGPETDTHFGQSVGLWSKGSAAGQPIVRAPGSNSLYFFETGRPGSRSAKLAHWLSGEHGFGTTLSPERRALSSGALTRDLLFVGTPGAGAGFVDVFVDDPNLDGPLLEQRIDQLALSENADGDGFGAALAVGDFNGDGALELAVGAPGERARGACGPASGALFVFEASEPGSCNRLFPVKVFSQEGGIEEFERPLRPWRIGARYEIGDRVHLHCHRFEALFAHESSSANAPSANSTAWSVLGGFAPVD